jgi:hypothetical protein
MTRITKGRSLRTTPDEDRLSPPSSLRRWGGIAAVATAAVLAVTGLTAGAVNDSTDHASGGRAAGDATGNGAIPTAARRIECVWSSDITSEVGPADDIGRPPVPDAALVMERCDGVWTGSLAWLVPGVGADVGRRQSDPPTASACSRPGSADAFLPGSPGCRSAGADEIELAAHHLLPRLDAPPHAQRGPR